MTTIDTTTVTTTTFSMPAGGPPGSPEWEVAELAAVKRAGTHEAMESFGFDPHQLGDDVSLTTRGRTPRHQPAPRTAPRPTRRGSG